MCHVGTIDASLASPREVYRFCLLVNAQSVIVAHNHPSGNPEPSREDVAVTKQLVEAGRVMGIPVHDHLILAGRGYTSLAERDLCDETDAARETLCLPGHRAAELPRFDGHRT